MGLPLKQPNKGIHMKIVSSIIVTLATVSAFANPAAPAHTAPAHKPAPPPHAAPHEAMTTTTATSTTTTTTTPVKKAKKKAAAAAATEAAPAAPAKQ